MPSIDLGTTFTPTYWTCGEFQGSTDLYDGCHTVKPLCNHYSEEGFGVHCSTLDHWHGLIICLYFNSHYLCDRTLLHPFLKQNEPGWRRQWLLKCMDLDSCLSSFQPQTQTVFCSTYLEVTVNLVPFILTNKLSRHVSDSNYWCPSDAGFVLEKSQHIGSCFPQSPITCLIFLFIQTCSFWLLPTSFFILSGLFYLIHDHLTLRSLGTGLRSIFLAQLSSAKFQTHRTHLPK